MSAELDQDNRRHAEAAKWVARMQRPDAERYRSDLDAWLAADRAHLLAYNKASARFHDARILSQSGIRRPTQPVQQSHRNTWPLVVASAVVVVILSGIWLAMPETNIRQGGREDATVARPQPLARADNPDRIIARKRLPDGTWATLDTDSKMRLMFSDRQRDIWLERGRVRFEVAHEQRPFVVHAGDGTITATGTLFDVAVDEHGSVRVTLLQGGVDVRPRVKAGASPFRLKAGQMLQIADTGLAASVSPVDRHERGWVDGMMEFDVSIGAQTGTGIGVQ